MKKFKNAFTMLEMVFVIVILGILAAVAVPHFTATRLDAQITKGKSDVSSIRSAIISERQSRLIKGDSSWITKLHNATTYFENNGTTTCQLLMYGVTPENKDGHWYGVANPTATTWTYKYKLQGADNTFTYDSTDGTFKCTAGTYCNQLTR